MRAYSTSTPGEFLRQSTNKGGELTPVGARGLAWAIYGFATHMGLRTMNGCSTLLGLALISILRIRLRMVFRPTISMSLHQTIHTKAPPPRLQPLVCSIWRASVVICIIVSRPCGLSIHSPGRNSLRSNSWLGRLIKHGMYHQRKGLGVDGSVMWGDYFFLEAVQKVLDE